MLKLPEPSIRLGLAVLIIAASALSASAALAGSDTARPGVLGNWCTLDGGERLLIEETTVSLNEHTICDVKEPLPVSSSVKGELSCANIYFHGNEIIRAFEKNMTFRAEMMADEQLEVTFREEGEPPQSLRYRRCDN